MEVDKNQNKPSKPLVFEKMPHMINHTSSKSEIFS
jgi:hypothetical protein